MSEEKDEKASPKNTRWGLWRIGAILHLSAILGVGVGLICFAFPPRSNHVGFDIRWAWLLSGTAVMFGLSGFLQNALTSKSGWWRIALISAGVTLALLVFFMDYNNLLVDYGLWCSRGMPSRWAH